MKITAHHLWESELSEVDDNNGDDDDDDD